MARHIMLVEKSLTMRKILQNMILANIGDAIVHEAWSTEEALEQLDKIECNLVLFHIDESTTDWKKLIEKATKGKKKIPVVALSSTVEGQHIQEAKTAGAQEFLALPCSPEDLVDTINRACNPMKMRFAKRYNIADTTVKIEQGRHVFEAQVVNISQGGLLCDFQFYSDFRFANPAMITLNFLLEGEKICIPGFYSVVSRLSVDESNADFSPRTLRIAYRFINVIQENQSRLEEVFLRAEKSEAKMEL